MKVIRISPGGQHHHTIADSRSATAHISHGSHHLHQDQAHKIASVTFAVDHYRIELSADEVRAAMEFITTHRKETL